MKKFITALLSFFSKHPPALTEPGASQAKIIVLYPGKRKKKAKLFRMF
jgi:hypothetical protein